MFLPFQDERFQGQFGEKENLLVNLLGQQSKKYLSFNPSFQYENVCHNKTVK